MKYLILLILSLSITINSFGQESEKKIKTINIAEYSPTRSGVISRSEVFDKKQSAIQKFDIHNKLKEYHQLNPSTKEIRNLYKYLNYKEQTATLIEIYNNENKLTSYTKQVLNSSNKLDTSYTYLASNEISGIQIYQYDSNKNLKTRIDSSFKYNRTLKWEYEFNSQNEMTKEISYDKDGMIRDTRTYKYDEKGQEFESDLTRANGDFTLFKSMYNENGDLTDNIWYDKEGSIKNHTKLVYEYDEFNNWITKKRSRDDEDFNYIWERKIEYFE